MVSSTQDELENESFLIGNPFQIYKQKTNQTIPGLRKMDANEFSGMNLDATFENHFIRRN